MNSVIQKIRSNDLVFILLSLMAASAPLILKLVVSGLIGHTFSFYFFVVWLPLVIVSLAVLRGWQEASIAGALVIGTFMIALLSYPPMDAPMDFRRQLVNQLSEWIVFSGIVAVGSQVALRRMRNKKSH
ncbi:hypothetical protein [Bdellovibrio sp. HCB337]|uniref:hypothetical protein n=1 Tax=Bdellovibrio sp. HCB337 TaxID=3394358 RepID=UPI0039A4FA3C